MQEECSKFGAVERVIIYNEKQSEDDDAEVIVKIFVEFKDSKSAKACKDSLHSRYFGGRIISAEIYDQDLYDHSDFSGWILVDTDIIDVKGPCKNMWARIENRFKLQKMFEGGLPLERHNWFLTTSWLLFITTWNKIQCLFESQYLVLNWWLWGPFQILLLATDKLKKACAFFIN